jgi:hypothetical protein
MITSDGGVKVLDFGIARAARGSEQAASSSVHGTIAYAAPEVLAGTEGDARVDVYGLGAVMYELLTGAPPFRGSEDHAIAQRLRVERPMPPRAWNPTIDEELDRVVVRCLRRSPAERHADVAALARELRAIAEHAPSRTEPLRVLATAPIPRPVTTDPLPLVATHPPVVPDRRRRRPVRLLTYLAAAATAAGALAVAIPGFVALSAGVQATPKGPDPIPAPSGLAVTASCDGWMSTGVDLSWTPPRTADAIQVWRWDPGADDFALVGSLGPDVSFVRDADLGVDVTYRYRLRAVRGPYISPWSNEAEVGTPLLCVT